MAKSDESVGPGASDEARFIASLKRLRERRDWSQGELAKRMVASGWEGFHQTTISRIEKGERPVRLGEARGLAAALETSLEHMVMPTSDAEMLEQIHEAIDHAMRLQEAIGLSVKGYLMSQQSLGLLMLNVEKRRDEGEAEEDDVTRRIQDALDVARDIREMPVEGIVRRAVLSERMEDGFLPEGQDDGKHPEA